METKSRVWDSPLLKHLLIGLAACVTYVLAAKLSLRLATVHPTASPFGPPTGLAILTLLLLGQPIWPAIFLGAVLVRLTTAGSMVSSLGIASGHRLGAAPP